MNSLFLRLRRITTTQLFIPEIDGLRFVAIASVFVHHMAGQLERYYGITAGPELDALLISTKRGVELFFVISGFVLARPFAMHALQHGEPVSLKSYFLRRLTRLEPPFILNIVLSFVLLVLVNHYSASTLLPHLVATLLYAHVPLFGQVSTINPVSWSLEVEVQFYLIVPLLVYVFALPAPLRRTVMLVAILCLGAVQKVPIDDGFPRVGIFKFLPLFLAGFLFCDLHVTAWRSSKTWRWDVLALILWPLVFVVGDTSAYFNIVWPLLVLMSYVASFRGPVVSWILRLPMLTAIGGMCYSIYLFHFMFIALVTRLLGYRGRPSVVIALCTAVTLAGSCVYYLLIERPCMDRRWPRRVKEWVLTTAHSAQSRP